MVPTGYPAGDRPLGCAKAPITRNDLNLRTFDKGFDYGSHLLQTLAENGTVEEALSLESA
jgi:hypothetical protein